VVNTALEQCEEKEIIQFREDNIWTAEHLYFYGNECVIEKIENGNYSVSDNKIILTYPNDQTTGANIIDFEINEDILSLIFIEGNYILVQKFQKTTDPLFSELLHYLERSKKEMA